MRPTRVTAADLVASASQTAAERGVEQANSWAPQPDGHAEEHERS